MLSVTFLRSRIHFKESGVIDKGKMVASDNGGLLAGLLNMHHTPSAASDSRAGKENLIP